MNWRNSSGWKSIEKCFTEYMMLTIAKAKKYEELQCKQNKKDNDFGVFGEDEE